MTFLPRTETYVNLASLQDPFVISVTKPAGTVDGDILFCWIGSYPGVIDAVPSGWNLLGEYLVNPDKYRFYYKIASSEPASWVWSFTANTKVRAVCSCYTGGDFNPSDPIDVVSNTPYRTNDVICRAASMTVSAANSPLVFWGGVYTTASTTFTKPSVPTTDWVEDDDIWDTAPDMATEVCSMIWSGSGATGDMDATISAALATKHAFAVALNPAVGVTHISVLGSTIASGSLLTNKALTVSGSTLAAGTLLSDKDLFIAGSTLLSGTVLRGKTFTVNGSTVALGTVIRGKTVTVQGLVDAIGIATKQEIGAILKDVLGNVIAQGTITVNKTILIEGDVSALGKALTNKSLTVQGLIDALGIITTTIQGQLGGDSRHYYYDKKRKKPDELFSMIKELLKEMI